MKIFKLAVASIFLGLGTVWSQDYTPHAYQQNDWFLEFGENTAQYVNPASIAENDQIEISLGLFQTINGAAGQEFLAVVHPFDYNHSAGFTIFENGSSLDEQAGFTPPAYLENAYQFAYAYRFGPKMPGSHKWSVGANATLLQFSLFDLKRFFSWGLDLGVSYNPISNSRFGHLQFGWALQNFRQPKVELVGDGNNEFENYAIPMSMNFSVFWRGLNRRLEVAGSYSAVNFVGEAEGAFGAFPDFWVDTDEFQGSFKHLYSGRITYYIGPMLGLKLKYSKQGYPMVGGTINMKRINLFRYLQLDVDVSHDQFSTEDKGRGFAFNVKAVTRVGPTREERIGAARYRRLKLEPENLYREAMRLYLARKFLEASYKFGEVLTKYPAFHLVDQAAFYKGKSFENLRMHTAAREVYTKASKKYDMSDVKPRYIFQLMNIDYKEAKYADAAEKYQLISNLYKDSDVKPDADYVMGQIRFIEGDYSNSIRLLKPILPGNGNYVYARYTLAMAYFRQKKNDEAVAALKDIMDISPANISEQELQDIASVKLGHFSFDAEPPRLVEAAKYYAAVPPSSSKYDEALLGLSWSFLRANRYAEAKTAADNLISAMPNSFLVGEAYLLRGFCLYFEKKYQESINALDKAVEMSESQVISEEEQAKRESKNQQTEVKFEDVQKRALSLSIQLPSARVLQKRDQLRPEFDQVRENIEDYIAFLERVGESNRFVENRERVIRDAKFTKATVRNILQSLDEKRGPSVDELQELELEE